MQQALLAVLAAGLIFAQLGRTHLANYDDCLYAQKAKEMLRGGDWITPHWAGGPRLDNPPFFLWLQALSFAALGVKNYAAILPSALSGVLAVVATHRLAGALGLGAFAAWASAFVLLTTQYFLKYARHAMFDVFLTLLFVLALLAYRRARQGSVRAWAGVGACTALGVLTKSVMGFFPLAVVLLHLLWAQGPRALRQPGPWIAIAVAAVGGGWWFAWQAMTRPDLLAAEYRFLIWERMVLGPGPASGWHRLDYLASLARVYWPWLPLALWGAALCGRLAFGRMPAAAAAGLPDRGAARLLLLWPVFVVGIMSLANEKKLWYLMSVFPALAMLSAIALSSWIRGEDGRRRALRAGYALLAVAALALNLGPWPAGRDRRPDLQAVALTARETVPPGRAVLNLDAGYHSTNPQFLFYSDHPLTTPLREPAVVRRGLDAGEYALLTRAGYAAVVRGRRERYPVIAFSGDWLLVKRAPPVPARLPARDPFR